MLPLNGSSIDFYRLVKAIEAERFAEAEKERLAAGIRSERKTAAAPGRFARIRAAVTRRPPWLAPEWPAIRPRALASPRAAHHSRHAA